MNLGPKFYAKASGLARGTNFDLRESQRIYFPRHCGASIIDPVRVLLEAGGFNWRALIVPDTANESFAARIQFEDQVSATPGSYLVSVSAHVDTAAPSDFVYSITDKGSGETLASSWLRYGVNTGNVNGKFTGRQMPFFLPVPWLVRAPGILGIRITNMASITQAIRLMLQFAEPTGSRES